MIKSMADTRSDLALTLLDQQPEIPVAQAFKSPLVLVSCPAKSLGNPLHQRLRIGSPRSNQMEAARQVRVAEDLDLGAPRILQEGNSDLEARHFSRSNQNLASVTHNLRRLGVHVGHGKADAVKHASIGG